MNKNKQLNIVLLFSLGIPLKLWEESGLAAREKTYYERFIKEGHSVSMLTYGKQDLEYQRNWSPIRILPWLGRLNHFVVYACLAPFYHYKAFKKANIVKSNQSQGALVGAIAKLVNWKLKFVLRCGWVRTKETIRDEENRHGLRYYRAIFFEWLGYKLADAIIVVTQSDADYLVERYSANRQKINIIPNSIDTSCYQFAQSRFTKESTVRILLVGRLVAAKNFHKVFEAVSKINRKIEITIIGSGDYKKHLENEAEKQGVNTSFVGSVPNDELAKIYSENDIVIMPEAWGSGMPKVVLEAMASGTVIIASNIRSVMQLLRDGENGFICEPTVASIEQTLNTVLKTSNKELQAMTKVARDEVDAMYSMQACFEKEQQLYLGLNK